MSRRHKKISGSSPSGPDEHTLLLLTGDDFYDHSIYNHTVTNSGVTLDTANAKFQSCYYFNGSSKLNTDIGAKKITNGTFTLEMWVKLSNTTKSYKCISDFCDHSTFYFDASDSRDGTLILMNGAASWQANGSYIYSSSKSVLLSTAWMHVAIVGNDNGHNYLYINGVKQTGNYFESCTNIMHMSNGKIQFGNIALNMSRYLQGYLEEIRFSNVVRYTSNFIPQSFR